MKQTLASFTLVNRTGYGAAPKVRVWADVDFQASTGEVHEAGNFERNYREIALTPSGSDWALPSTVFDTNTDAIDEKNSTYSATIVDSSGQRRDTLFSNYSFKASLGSTITWADLVAANETFIPLRDDDVYSKGQVDARIASQLNVGNPAGVGVLGRVEMATAPADPARPKAVGDNDPRIVGVVTSTLAGLPTPGTHGRLRKLTDSARDVRIDTGSQWASLADVINVKMFGARGDARSVSGGAMSAGSAVLTVSGGLTAADAGKTIVVPGAGASGADLVTTILTYTSATQATLAASASTTVASKIVMYGTNDTAAVQAALDAAAALSSVFPLEVHVPPGATVFFPGGIYLVSSLTLQPATGATLLYGAHILGTGYSSRIATFSPTADVLTVTASSIVNSCSVRNLQFRPAVTRTAGWELAVPRSYDLTLTDLTFEQTWGGIELGRASAPGPSERVYMSRIKMHTYRTGLYTYRVIGLWFDSANFSANRVDSTSIKLDSNTEGATFTGMDVSNPALYEPGNVGIALHLVDSNAALPPPRNLRFIGCFFDSHKTGVQADAGVDVSFIGGFFHALERAIDVAGAATDSFRFNEVSIRGSGDMGIIFGGGANHSIMNSAVVGNDFNNLGASGIVLLNGVPGVRIQGNRVMNGTADWDAAGGTHHWGIWIWAGADNFIVTGNDTRGNTVAGIQNDAGTGATKIVANNLQ